MREETVAKYKVTHKGNFNMDVLYNSLYLWFKEQEYKDQKENDDFYEILYQEIVSGEAKNMNIWWRPQKKLDKYMQQLFNVNFQTIGLRKVELQEGNKKVKTFNGEITIEVEAKFIYDYDGLW